MDWERHRLECLLTARSSLKQAWRGLNEHGGGGGGGRRLASLARWLGKDAYGVIKEPRVGEGGGGGGGACSLAPIADAILARRVWKERMRF